VPNATEAGSIHHFALHLAGPNVDDLEPILVP
jgi:hypothetical protein